MTNQQTSVPDTIHNASDQEQEVERPKDGQNPLQENHEEAESDCPAHDEDYSTFLAFSGTYSKEGGHHFTAVPSTISSGAAAASGTTQDGKVVDQSQVIEVSRNNSPKKDEQDSLSLAQDEIMTWKCPACTLLNKDCLYCEACGTTKDGFVSPATVSRIAAIEKALNVKNISVPPCETAAAYEAMETSIKESIQKISGDADAAPVPVDQVAASYEAIEYAKRISKKKNQAAEQANKIMQRSNQSPSSEPPNTSSNQETIVEGGSNIHLSPISRVNQDSSSPDDERHIAIEIRPPPQSMLVSHQESNVPLPSAPPSSIPVIEAMLVPDRSAIEATPITNQEPTWRKRHQKHFLLTLGAMTATAIGLLVGLLAGNDSGSLDHEPATQSTISPYYAVWERKRCDNDPLRKPRTELGHRLFDTVQDCCQAE